jgi:hypothetical protein
VLGASGPNYDERAIESADGLQEGCDILVLHQATARHQEGRGQCSDFRRARSRSPPERNRRIDHQRTPTQVSLDAIGCVMRVAGNVAKSLDTRPFDRREAAEFEARKEADFLRHGMRLKKVPGRGMHIGATGLVLYVSEQANVMMHYQ